MAAKVLVWRNTSASDRRSSARASMYRVRVATTPAAGARCRGMLRVRAAAGACAQHAASVCCPTSGPSPVAPRNAPTRRPPRQPCHPAFRSHRYRSGDAPDASGLLPDSVSVRLFAMTDPARRGHGTVSCPVEVIGCGTSVGGVQLGSRLRRAGRLQALRPERRQLAGAAADPRRGQATGIDPGVRSRRR